MNEERLWIGGSCIYPESEMERCCRWTIYRSRAAESGELVECKACGMKWHAEGTIRDYRCGCSIGPEFTHLCKAAEELESALFEAASDHAITEESPKGFSEAERREKSDVEIEARRQLSQHLSSQVRAGRYRDVAERVLFEHSEPDAERMNH